LKLGGRFTEQMVAEFDRRRKFMVGRLNNIPGVSCRMPSGAFYAFPNIRAVLGRYGPLGPLTSPQELANHLLTEAHVAVVAGEPFGSHDHIRLSYATSMDAIQKGLDRLAKTLGRLSA
jgi:aspartate aminotransferase